MTMPIMRRALLPVSAAIALASGVYLQAYVDSGRRWSGTSVLYYVNPESIYLSPDLAVNAVRMAATTWNNTNANIELIYAGTTNSSALTLNYKNEVFYRDGSNGSYVAETYTYWDGNNRYLDGDIVFHEGAFKYFSVSGCQSGVYAENVATHEFGHMLGLKHSTVTGATMYATMPGYCDRTWSTLSADDVSGIVALYPPETTTSTPSNTAPTVTVASPANNVSYAESTTITFSGSARDVEDGDLTARLVWTSSVSGQIGTGGSFSRTLPAGTHTITARVTDSGNLAGSVQGTLTVTAAASGSNGHLSARAYKVKGQQKADLTWDGVQGTTVDVYRNGAKIVSMPNDGRMTDNINNKGGGSYRYTVCTAGSSTCTNEAVASF
jgi:hypothetical protein